MKCLIMKCLFEKYHFSIGGFSRVSGRFSRKAGQQFLGQSNMLNISFKSRVFSSETLLDGESIMASHSYENMDTDQLLAELARLEDPG